jgi:hypothetical protein
LDGEGASLLYLLLLMVDARWRRRQVTTGVTMLEAGKGLEMMESAVTLLKTSQIMEGAISAGYDAV